MLKKELGTGVMGQISWERLAQILKDSRNLFPKEEIEAFKATNDGLVFKIKD